ncbi:COG4315 family predicted lipoprotein [Tessaracoccus terricola]
MSLAGTLCAAGATLTVLVLVGCTGATESGTPPATEPAPPATTAAETMEESPAATDPAESPAETDSATDPAETDPGTEPASPMGGVLALTMAESDLGEILVDGDGMTLYLFTNDTRGSGASTCEGQCLVNWPPLVGVPTAGEGVDDSKLGSFTKPDGTVQATYNGWPLYYWVQDTEPGQTTGQGVQGVWFVLDRDGEAVGG